MFIGYEIKSQQNQAKPVVLETDMKLSQAVLDPSKGGKKEPVCLMVEYEKKQFIIAVLDPARSWQCPLDLMFSAGSEVKFFVKGSGTVHLTGFQYRDDMNSELGFDTSSEEEEEDEDEEEVPKAVEQSKGTEKRASKINATKAKTNGVGKAAKKDAKKPAGGDQADSDDDESDDEDFNSDMMDDDDLEGSDEELDDDLDLEGEDEESEEDEDDE